MFSLFCCLKRAPPKRRNAAAHQKEDGTAAPTKAAPPTKGRARNAALVQRRMGATAAPSARRRGRHHLEGAASLSSSFSCGATFPPRSIKVLLSPSPSVNRAASSVPPSVGTAFFVLLWGGAFTSSSCVELRNPCLFGMVLLVVLLFSTLRVGGALFFTCFSCGVAFVFLPFMGGAASLLPLSCFLSPKLVDLMDVKKIGGTATPPKRRRLGKQHHRKKAASLPSGLVLHYPSLFLF